ncbi:glycosyltransferase family 2 protein [uncultured Salegentibacter sp.]|uniref:glycosyltransferase family 2 protein n=1 Tax=uncultured Salegentibacter sp. TaxID=259320 RepID=UPI00259478CE|nr:glycosyltransferase family 2 protein [uncultured Salegentibacter sp.]
MKSAIQISIILATWNRAHLISETLNSISNQTFPNWECLIIDDGSEDNTANVVEEYTSTDSRFTYLARSQKYKKGLPGCRNQGLDLAKGEYIIFFDDDDIVHPENLQTCYNLLKGNDFQFCRYEKKPFWKTTDEIDFKPIKDPEFKIFKCSDLDKMIIGRIPFASCCVLWDKKCFENIRFNETLMYAEEWECYSRILSTGYKGLLIDEVLYYNRKHRNSNTGEFQNREPIRVDSQCKAAFLIIQTLISKGRFSNSLKKYFLRLGFEIKSYKIIKLSLKAANAGLMEKWKYKIGYHIYPVLKPIFYLKGKILKD